MIVIYRAKTLSLMQVVEDRLQKYVHRQIKNGKYDCQLIWDRESQRPKVAQNPDGFWVYLLVQE